MTQDEIIEMAIQGHASTRDAIRWAMNQEREACAKACEDKGLTWKFREDINPENARISYMSSQFIAHAIRARGEA